MTRRVYTYFLPLLFTCSLVPAQARPDDPEACLASVRGTLYSKIAPDLKPAFIAVITNLLKNQTGKGFSAIGSLALLQAAGVEGTALDRIKAQTFESILNDSLDDLSEVASVYEDDKPIFLAPDFSLAQALINQPLFLPSESSFLSEGPSQLFEKKWALDGIKRQTFLLQAQVKPTSPVLGPVLLSYLELALQLNQLENANQILDRIVYNGDLSTMLKAAVLMQKPALVVNLARLAFSERLTNPTPETALETGKALKALGSITDPNVSEVARLLLYDFAWRMVHPTFLKPFAGMLERTPLDDQGKADVLKNIEFQNIKLALMALFETGVKKPGAHYAPGAPFKIKIVEYAPAKGLASKIIENLSAENATDADLDRIMVWLAPSLPIQPWLLKWGRHLASQPRVRRSAIELLYGGGDFQNARKRLTGVIERELASGVKFESLKSASLIEAVRTLADFGDEIGLTWTQTLVAAHVTALYRNPPPLERGAIREWEKIMQKMQKLRANLCTENYFREFHPDRLEPRPTRFIHKQSDNIRKRLNDLLEFGALDDDSRRDLIAEGFMAMADQDFLYASACFDEANYRRGVVQAANGSAAIKSERKDQELALYLYVLASQMQDIPEPPPAH